MGRAISVLFLIAILAVIVNGHDNRLNAKIRVRRGFSNSGFGANGGVGRGYGQNSDEQDASVSREAIGGCSGENGRSYSGSRELAYNRDSRSSNDNQRGGRAFSKSSASASATASAFNQNQKAAVDA